MIYFYIKTKYGLSWWNASVEVFGARAFTTPIEEDEVLGESCFIGNDILTTPQYQGQYLRSMTEEEFKRQYEESYSD